MPGKKMNARKALAKKRRSDAVKTPLLKKGKAVDWWFVFKLNAAEQKGNPKPKGMTGIFDHPDWRRPTYDNDTRKFSQHFLFASSDDATLQHGKGILGTSVNDPVGATFDQVYHGQSYYVIWNDQFYGDPRNNSGSPWGHSKGMVAWDDNGDGFVMQVSTPSWPAAGSEDHPRETDGNTLGFVKDDDVEMSQHFFALKINKADLLKVLEAMCNARVVTSVRKKQVVNNGGPADVQAQVKKLGKRPVRESCLRTKLSSGVQLISKPASMAVPPWQLVSAILKGVDLRVVSYWTSPAIYSTKRSEKIPCWDDDLPKKIGAVDIATDGSWNKINLGFKGGPGATHNHAKFAVSTSGKATYSIFGDMNQQGALCKNYTRVGQKCSSSQNGRGGMFFVLHNKTIFESLTRLMAGGSAATSPPPKKSATKRVRR